MLTNYNGTSISYDAIGNPSNWRNAAAIEWSGRQLSNFGHNDGTITGYSYNADGIRTKKTVYDTGGSVVSRTNYTLDGNKIVAESRNGTNIYYLYDDKGAIMGISYGYDTYTFAKNIQGDVIGIYSGGALVAKYEYNAYGQILSITNASGADISNNASHIANINPFRYRGYYYDTETGFYYLQSRYYDPVVGRFLNSDVAIGANGGIIGYNLFAYCNNNPVIHIDSLGQCMQMWADGKQGPCPGPEYCDDYVEACNGYTHIALYTFRGWEIRIDNPHVENSNGQRHIHVEKGAESYAQNADGSPSHKSKGSPPKKVKEYIKKIGWDWDDKSDNYNNKNSGDKGNKSDGKGSGSSAAHKTSDEEFEYGGIVILGCCAIIVTVIGLSTGGAGFGLAFVIP